MKKIFLIALTLTVATPAFAQEYTHGYTRRDGTEVQGYMHSTPNGIAEDNYSYKGNVNPYTGSVGTHTERDAGEGYGSPYPSYQSNNGEAERNPYAERREENPNQGNFQPSNPW